MWSLAVLLWLCERIMRAGETGPIVCGCAPGWTGPQCNVQMTCVWGTFLNSDPPKCLCQTGFSGASCDIPIPEPIQVGSLLVSVSVTVAVTLHCIGPD